VGGGSVFYGWDKLGNISSSNLSSWSSTLGKPAVVGQYLDWSGGSVLNSSTVSGLHSAGVKIELIMDNDQAFGNGTSDANLAASQAKALGSPANGTIAIFRDVEPSVSPSVSYINAWYSQLLADGFIPGFYMNPATSDPFVGNFCSASSSAIAGSYLWSQQPQRLSSPTFPASYQSSSAPTNWIPNYPSCTIGNTVAAWQYQIAGSTGSPVDVDLAATIGAW